MAAVHVREERSCSHVRLHVHCCWLHKACIAAGNAGGRPAACCCCTAAANAGCRPAARPAACCCCTAGPCTHLSPFPSRDTSEPSLPPRCCWCCTSMAGTSGSTSSGVEGQAGGGSSPPAAAAREVREQRSECREQAAACMSAAQLSGKHAAALHDVHTRPLCCAAHLLHWHWRSPAAGGAWGAAARLRCCCCWYCCCRRRRCCRAGASPPPATRPPRAAHCTCMAGGVMRPSCCGACRAPRRGAGRLQLAHCMQNFVVAARLTERSRRSPVC